MPQPDKLEIPVKKHNGLTGKTPDKVQTRLMELEAQNEDLRRRLMEAGKNLVFYTHFYDSVPIACFIFAPDGIILEINLAAASMFGIRRNDLIDRLFGFFVIGKDRTVFDAFLGRIFASHGKGKEFCEVVLEHLGDADAPCLVHIEAVAD